MSEPERLYKQLQHAYEGDAWHGPALLEILKEVTFETAFEIPKGLNRSIAGSLLHMMVWMEFVVNASSGQYKKVTKEEDWPKPPETTLEYWQSLLVQYKEQHDKVLAYIAGFPEERLNEKIPEVPFNHYFLFQGVIQHNVYHTAQIALIKRLVSSI